MRRKKQKNNSKRKFILVISLCLLGFIAIGGGYFYITKTSLDLSFWETYQNLANPNVRYVKITAGMRREEVVDRVAKTLGWNEREKQKLIQTHTLALKGAREGYFFPQTYLFPKQANAEDVSKVILEAFNKNVVEKKFKSKENIINTDTAIKIASIIQRETNNRDDMNLISGIIWNRIFKGMTLDMDATLQYAKGNKDKWWPQVKPEDKKINSPYNTYKHKGLPPSAISNPGEKAIDAAINPATTKAIFYVHDKKGTIHTAVTYEEHKANIERYY